MSERASTEGREREASINVEALSRQAWESNEIRMISWHEVSDLAKGVLRTAVLLGFEAASVTEAVSEPAEAEPPAVRLTGRQSVSWDGPLFYPPTGKIAVMGSGDRIEVWPEEGGHQGCFTGLLLKPGRSIEQQRVHDLSCMWDRKAIDHIEEPNDTDIPLLGLGPNPLSEGRERS